MTVSWSSKRASELERKGNWSDFEWSLIVVRQAGLSVSQTADFHGFFLFFYLALDLYNRASIQPLLLLLNLRDTRFCIMSTLCCTVSKEAPCLHSEPSTTTWNWPWYIREDIWLHLEPRKPKRCLTRTSHMRHATLYETVHAPCCELLWPDSYSC